MISFSRHEQQVLSTSQAGVSRDVRVVKMTDGRWRCTAQCTEETVRMKESTFRNQTSYPRT